MYKDIKSLIQSRATVRAFRNDPVRDDDIADILRAGLQAPTASGGEEWLYFVVKDEKKRRMVRDLILDAQREYVEKMLIKSFDKARSAMYFEGVEREKTYWAPVYIFGYADLRRRTLVDKYKAVEEQWAAQSVVAALENMILMAWSRGLGTGWLGVPLLREKEFSALLGAPTETKLVGGITLGYPAVEPKPSERRPLEETVKFI